MLGWSSLGEDAGFGQISLHILGVRDSFRVGHLDRNRAVEVIVVSKIDPSEPALTQASEDRVTPDFGGIAVRGIAQSLNGRLRDFSFRQALVSSEEPPEPSRAVASLRFRTGSSSHPLLDP